MCVGEAPQPSKTYKTSTSHLVEQVEEDITPGLRSETQSYFRNLENHFDLISQIEAKNIDEALFDLDMILDI